MSFLPRIMGRCIRPGAFNTPRPFGSLRCSPLTAAAKPTPINFFKSSLQPRQDQDSYRSYSFDHRRRRSRVVQEVPKDNVWTVVPETPEEARSRRGPTINSYILYGIIGANCAVFLYAQYAKQQVRLGFPENFHNFYQNFTLNYEDVVRQGKYWTMVTSVFSHTELMHLLGNMISTFYIGKLVADTRGVTPLSFVVLIMGSGIAGSLFYLAFRRQKIQEQTKRTGFPPLDMQRGLGFSGAVMGVGSAAAFMYPRVTLSLYGIIPVPLWALMAGYAIFDGYYLNSSTSRVAHSGHLGGLFFGGIYYFAKLRGLPVRPW
ncbi:unnamed protein product [Periconia digitata]|uniref:Peptidase S54 rhomboid domain-containing protein n=1 Tax=Periconia digitata TaxID=1303443 RepID=A0A9W4ULQ0_9PLEO|nr:unnamed protein product [Periconia digitata]